MPDFDTFDALTGTEVNALSPEHGSVPLQVLSVEKAAGDRPDNAYSVLFKGPLDLFLEQMTYDFALGDSADSPIFVVPVMEEPDGYVYEAVFTTLDSDS